MVDGSEIDVERSGALIPSHVFRHKKTYEDESPSAGCSTLAAADRNEEKAMVTPKPSKRQTAVTDGMGVDVRIPLHLKLMASYLLVVGLIIVPSFFYVRKIQQQELRGDLERELRSELSALADLLASMP